MRDALSDPNLFGSVLTGESWAGWRVLLIAIAGEPLTDNERVVFTALTGREREPRELIEEFWGIIGRRSGKTRAMAVLAAWIAALCDHSAVLAPGERGTLPILSASVWQAGKALQYLNGIFTQVPALAALVEGQTTDSISLKTGIDIECLAANYRTVRGGTAVAVLCDEVAFWRGETSATPDTEILSAIRPSLATTGGPLIVISSPYSRRGELWTAFKRDYGAAGDPAILIAKAASSTLNPSLSEKFIARAYERDPTSAAAELGAEFRTDVESFVSRESIDAAIVPGRLELPYVSGVNYFGFVDPSGGAQDSMTLAIAHAEGDVAVLDAVREVKPPFSPESVVSDFTALLAHYHVFEVTGDRWGGEFVQELFNTGGRGVDYVVSEFTKSQIYHELLPLLNSKRVELLDLPRLTSQLAGLERRVARGGRDSIDHAPNNHDDVINAAAGALVLAAGIGDEDAGQVKEFMRAFGKDSQVRALFPRPSWA